jgi:hypothetical protein
LKKRGGKERTEKEGIVFFLIHLTCGIYTIVMTIKSKNNGNELKGLNQIRN